jgi:phospholipid/cholesterol/gamma-HCH transport system substrate-binding protein
VKISKEFKVGLMGIVSMAILYLGFNFLKGIDFFSKTTTYYALYDRIDGLTASNPVIINGLSVGRVGDIRILQDQGNKILVEFSVGSDLRLGIGSVCKLVNVDFLGSKAIELLPADQPVAYHMSYDTLASSIDPGIAEFLKENALPVADNLGATIARINTILEEVIKNGEKFTTILNSVRGITTTLDRDLPAITDNLKGTLAGLEQNSSDLSVVMTDLRPVIAKADQLADTLTAMELGRTMEQLTLALENLNANLALIKEGEGTMGKLMHDDSLYVYLSATARDLDRLLVDLRERPGRYVQVSVFGKKDKYDKKEKDKEL